MKEIFYKKMIKEYSENTSLEIEKTSDAGLKFAVVSSFLSDLYKKLEEVEANLLPTTATGDYLDSHGELRGIIRNGGAPSTGKVTFVRDNINRVDIFIKKSTLCQTLELEAKNFLTLEDTILKSGENSVMVLCKSEDLGEESNISAFKIGYLPVNIEGIFEIYNEEIFTGGRKKEEDSSFRKKIINNYQSLSNGMNTGYYINLLSNFEEVLDSKIEIINSKINIILYAKEELDVHQLLEIKNYIISKKELGKEVVVLNAQRKLESFHIKIKVDENSTRDFFIIANEFKERINNYLDTLEIGEDLRLSKIVSLGIFDKDIIDATILEPYFNIEAKESERIVINNITIKRWL